MNTRLGVLGLLARRPMHGYEVQQYLQLSYADRWAGVQTGSIYHALRQMEREGLVAVRSTEQTGHRTRAIYAITETGRDEFRRLLREAWRTPSPVVPASLYAALTFLDDLPRDEVLRALDDRIAATEDELALLDEGEAAKVSAAGPIVPEYLRVTFANSREHIAVDLRFLRYLRETLPTALVVPLEPPPLPGSATTDLSDRPELSPEEE